MADSCFTPQTVKPDSIWAGSVGADSVRAGSVRAKCVGADSDFISSCILNEIILPAELPVW